MWTGLLVIALLTIAAVRSANHGGRVAQALRSNDPATRHKAEGVVAGMIAIGALCLIIVAWPLVLIIIILAIIGKFFK